MKYLIVISTALDDYPVELLDYREEAVTVIEWLGEVECIDLCVKIRSFMQRPSEQTPKPLYVSLITYEQGKPIHYERLKDFTK